MMKYKHLVELIFNSTLFKVPIHFLTITFNQKLFYVVLVVILIFFNILKHQFYIYKCRRYDRLRLLLVRKA